MATVEPGPLDEVARALWSLRPCNRGLDLARWDTLRPDQKQEHIEEAVVIIDAGRRELRKYWEAEQLEAMRSDVAVTMVAMRLEEINGESTSEEEREDLARKILHDLTSPRIVSEDFVRVEAPKGSS